jgi:hypothetical protein
MRQIIGRNIPETTGIYQIYCVEIYIVLDDLLWSTCMNLYLNGRLV